MDDRTTKHSADPGTPDASDATRWVEDIAERTGGIAAAVPNERSAVATRSKDPVATALLHGLPVARADCHLMDGRERCPIVTASSW